MLLHIMHSSDSPPSPPMHIHLTLLPGQLLTSSKLFPCCVQRRQQRSDGSNSAAVAAAARQWDHSGGSGSGSANKVMSLAAWRQLGGAVGSAAVTRQLRQRAVMGRQRGSEGNRSAVAVAAAWPQW
jgi:hypothetical protein